MLKQAWEDKEALRCRPGISHPWEQLSYLFLKTGKGSASPSPLPGPPGPDPTVRTAVTGLRSRPFSDGKGWVGARGQKKRVGFLCHQVWSLPVVVGRGTRKCCGNSPLSQLRPPGGRGLPAPAHPVGAPTLTSEAH